MKSMQSFESKNDLEEMVLIQLSKILMHSLFSSSLILSRFLNFIVNEALAGRQDQIKEYTIALYVLNKLPGFVPTGNPVVRVHAKRLRNALSKYYIQEGFNDDCLISIPRGRYIPFFEKSYNKQPSKKIGTASLYSVGESKKNRIAFLPFKTSDPGISHASLVDSLGEELTRQFSHRSDLSILSYHTTRTLPSEKTEIKNLVSTYQVQYLISGSIWFGYSKMKIFVELIDTASGSQIWAGIYYEPVGDSNYFRTVDNITSGLMSDLSKIKSLECDCRDQMPGIRETVKGKTDILYLDSYNKIPKSVKRLAGS